METHPEKRLIGYARASTYGQTLDSQLDRLLAAGCSSRNIHREKATGAWPDRRELNLMQLGAGGVVTVTRIDASPAARSIYSASSSASWTPRRSFNPWRTPWADTGTSTGRLMVAVLGGLTDVEHGLIRTAPPKAATVPNGAGSKWAGPRD